MSGEAANEFPQAGMVRDLLRAQLVLIALVAVAWLVFAGRPAGAHALLGGAVAWSGTLFAFLVVIAFGRLGAAAALAAQLAGEGVKVVWTVLAFWLVLRRPDARAVPFITGFCVAWLGYLVGPVLGLARERR